MHHPQPLTIQLVPGPGRPFHLARGRRRIERSVGAGVLPDEAGHDGVHCRADRRQRSLAGDQNTAFQSRFMLTTVMP